MLPQRNPDDIPYAHACSQCGRIIAPGYPVCLHCEEQRFHLWRDRAQIQPYLKRQLEGGRPFFIASGTIILSVFLYLLLLA